MDQAPLGKFEGCSYAAKTYCESGDVCLEFPAPIVRMWSGGREVNCSDWQLIDSFSDSCFWVCLRQAVSDAQL